MSKDKVSRFYPAYQLRSLSEPADKGVEFDHQGEKFSWLKSMFGMTESQHRALRWAAWTAKTPPVAWLEHRKPTKSDKDPFYDPKDPHAAYFPYAMTVVTMSCLGETRTRQIKIYFCDVMRHEDNLFAKIHTVFKNSYVIELQD